MSHGAVGAREPKAREVASGSKAALGTAREAAAAGSVEGLILGLQARAGNRAVVQLLADSSPGGAQPHPAGTVSVQRDDPKPTGPTFGNLMPADEPNPKAIRWKLEYVDGQWEEVRPPGAGKPRRLAHGTYTYVVDGDVIHAHRSIGHVDLAQGKRVTWAGEMHFSERGKLASWTNASGHTRPSKWFAMRDRMKMARLGLTEDTFKAMPRGGAPGPQLPVWQPGTEPKSTPKPNVGSSGATGGKSGAVPSRTPPGGSQSTGFKGPAKPPPKGAGQAGAKAGTVRRISLGSVSTWGKVTPFDGAMLYLDLHAPHFAALENVGKRAALANALLKRIDDLDQGAHRLSTAADELALAEYELPASPLLSEEEGGFEVSPAEMAQVKGYLAAANRIATDAGKTTRKLTAAVKGWDDILQKAQADRDFTRARLWTEITMLDQRFQPGGFRNFLEEARQKSERVEIWVNRKKFYAADILGEWTPSWFEAPSPQ